MCFSIKKKRLWQHNINTKEQYNTFLLNKEQHNTYKECKSININRSQALAIIEEYKGFKRVILIEIQVIT